MDLRPERLLRWSGALVLVAVFAEELGALAAQAPALGTDAASSTIGSALGLVATLGSFAFAFWWVTGPGLEGKRPRLTAALLLLQTLLGTFVVSDLFYAVAMILPLVYPARRACLWLLLRNIVALPVFTVYVIGHPEAAEAAQALPLPWRLLCSIVPYLAWQSFAFAFGILAGRERQRRHQLVALNEQLLAAQELLAERTRLEERVEIARELHDSIGHHLAALNMQLELASHLTAGPGLQAITQAHGTGRQLLGELREVVSAWRRDAPFELPAALEQLARSIHQPQIVVRIESDPRLAESACARALFRCAQEAVTNAVRHASARHVWLELIGDDAGLCLSARDDGCGQAGLVLGNGLRGMIERAEALGGRVRFDTASGRGFEVGVWLPRVVSRP